MAYNRIFALDISWKSPHPHPHPHPRLFDCVILGQTL